jgi:class 3 adenylate cyclase
MSLKDDLQADVAKIFATRWSERDGQVVPDDESVSLGNDAVKVDATVLYADLADSTALVDGFKPFFAAEIYKTFLACSARIIRNEGGVITAYDGDRIMAVYMGNLKNTSAVRTSLKINWAVQNVIRPAVFAQYPKTTYVLRHVVGIDTSPLFVAKTGARGANDLVWVGRAANHAAKMAALPEAYATYISTVVHDNIAQSVKFGPSGATLWERVAWNTFDNRIIFRSNATWSMT